MRRMASDDVEPGHVLTRREMLGLLGAPGVLMLAGWPATMASTQSLPGCIVRPQQTEGPYFIDESLNRSDIRSDPSDGSVKPGAPLGLTFRVSRFSGNACAPLQGLLVDVYFDDALTDQVHARPPYAAKGQRSQRNSGDSIFARGGSQLVLAPVRDSQGYAATFKIALQNV